MTTGGFPSSSFVTTAKGSLTPRPAPQQEQQRQGGESHNQHDNQRQQHGFFLDKKPRYAVSQNRQSVLPSSSSLTKTSHILELGRMQRQFDSHFDDGFLVVVVVVVVVLNVLLNIGTDDGLGREW